MSFQRKRDKRQSIRPNPYAQQRIINPLFSRGKATMMLIVGGCAGAIAQVPQVGVDVVALFDCRREVERPGIHPGVYSLAVSWGTVGELLQELQDIPESVRQALRGMPAANDLQTGAGQFATLGGLALARCLKDGRLAELFFQMFEHLLILHGGSLESIEIVVVASCAGGTGSGMARKIAEVCENVLVERTPVQVTTTLHRIGPVTFAGCGDRVVQNASLVLPDDMAWYRSHKRHPRATRKLAYGELPLSGANGKARDRSVQGVARAMHSTGVQEQLALATINWAIGKAIGGITLYKSDLWLGPGPVEIAGDVARQFRRRVRDLIQTAPEDRRVLGVETAARRHDGHRRSPETLGQVATLETVKPANFDDELRRSAGYEGVVRVRLDGAGTEGLSYSASGEGTLETFLARPADSEESCRARLAELGAIGRRMDAEARDREKRLPHHEDLRRSADAELSRAVGLLWPAGFLMRLWAAILTTFKGRHGLVADFQAALAARWQADDEHGRIAFELEMFKRLAQVVQEARKALTQRLERLVEFADRHGGADSPPLVEVDGDLTGVLRAMAPHADASDEVLSGILLDAVRSVTLHGLARVVNADSAAPDDIVKALASEPYLKAPWFGGGLEPRASGVQMVVLPRAAEGVLANLDRAAAAMDINLRLVSCDAIAGGLTAVHLDVRPASHVSELFTPTIMTGLAAIRRNPDLWRLPDSEVDFQAYPVHGVEVVTLTKGLGSIMQEAA